MNQPPNGGATGSPSGPPSGDHTPGPSVGPVPPAPPGGGAFGAPAGPAPLGAPAAQPGPFGGPASPGSGALSPGYPPYHAPAAPKQRRGVLVAAIVAVLALLLCGGGGVAAFFTLRSTENGEGAKEPTVAVENFLTAVYKERDARKAAGYVCAAARDDRKITAKVTELKRYAEQYSDARFRWTSPKVDNQTGDRATVTTRVTMTTSDEKVADQDLRFTVVQKTGWWVCEIA
ncbi:hypothetical protein [Micromonospora sp. NPDC002575]|uniref:Rv0361 family membrane protein n=1 Tax=Micromonospora sp. NPDC002575 TaxID=3364222 RepID=UPI0036AC37F3